MPKTSATQRPTTIYNGDDSLSGNRTVDGGTHNLMFNNIRELVMSSTSGTVTTVFQLEADDPSTSWDYNNSSITVNNAIYQRDDGITITATDGSNLSTVKLDPGGSIFFQPQGYGSHSNGEVLTLIDNITGEVDYAPAAGGSGTVTSITASSPLTGGTITTSGSIGIADAVADGSTKGASSFTAADFNSSSGNISIDYTNGQAADASHKGFLTSTDWSTFNSKGSGTVTSVTGTTNRITSSGGTTPAIDISSTFEALLGKVASPLSQFAATTSAQLAGVISDGTGSGLVVFNNAPSLTNPTMTTQSAGDNSTKGASTAFVATAILNTIGLAIAISQTNYNL